MVQRGDTSHLVSWTALLSWLVASLGMSSTLASVLSNPFVWDSLKFLILGSIVETGRRIFQWTVTRFRIRLSISAEFNASDPAYEWLLAYLTKENIWQGSRDFRVEAKTSQRKWSVKPSGVAEEHVNYIPAFGSLHFFRWRGHWMELKTSRRGGFRYDDSYAEGGLSGTLYLTIYTLDVSALFRFVEECRSRFLEDNKSRITIYSSDTIAGYTGQVGREWNNVKMKRRRPIESLILDGSVLDLLLADARDFLAAQNWYIKAGIPHRRGYLLHGPPGTGKTTTVYAMAGELGLDIYSLSLASPSVDDDCLAREVSLLPPRGILLIEDIDCAFASRDDETLQEFAPPLNHRHRNSIHPLGRPKSRVTLSGLLNILDGIGSEEGKIFFATTNHLDRLDPALLRPGRIDRKIEYKLASPRQARALFKRFFPSSEFLNNSPNGAEPESGCGSSLDMDLLAEEFAGGVPENQFSTAELQGYLLDWKTQPVSAARGVRKWVQQENESKREQEAREKARQEKVEAAKARERLQANESLIAGIGTAIGNVQGSHRPPYNPPDTSACSDDEDENGRFHR